MCKTVLGHYSAPKTIKTLYLIVFTLSRPLQCFLVYPKAFFENSFGISSRFELSSSAIIRIVKRTYLKNAGPQESQYYQTSITLLKQYTENQNIKNR